MKQSLCVIALICVGLSCYSQNKRFLEGYIIKTNGDTLTGYIKNIGDQLRSEHVVFKPSLNSPETVYHGDEVKKYGIGERIFYESKPVNILGEGIVRKLFLRLLVDGEIRLYRLDYEIRPDEPLFYQHISTFYFYQVKGKDALQELREQGTEYEYRSTLEKEFSRSCKMDEVRSSTFDDVGLSNLIVAYNTCLGSSSVTWVEPAIEKNRNWNVSVSAGILESEIKTNKAAFDVFNLSPELGYMISAGFDFRITDGLDLQSGLSFLHRKASGTREHVVTDFYDNAGEVLKLVLSKV